MPEIPKVFVVDDEQDMRLAVRMLLERAGYLVDEAPDGQAALNRLNAVHPDVVLLDMRMPGLDGAQTLAKIRETNRELPVLMVTGYGSVDSAVEVMRMGANGYVSKPFHNKELLAAIGKAVKGKAPAAPVAAESPDDDGPRTRPLPWKKIFASAAGLAVLLVGLKVALSRDRTFVVPYSNPAAMAWQNDRLWISDWFTQSLYVHEARGRQLPIVKTYSLPNSHITGLALVGESIYVCDSWTKKIAKRKLDDMLSEVKSWPSPGPSPSGLFWDGKWLWSFDAEQGKIYQHNLDGKLTVLGEYRMPGKSPVAFYKDDTYAWTADTETRQVYQHRLDDKLTVLATYMSEEFDQRAEPLSAFSWKDGDFWFTRDRIGKVFRRGPSVLRKLEASK